MLTQTICSFCSTPLVKKDYTNSNAFFLSCFNHKTLAQIQTEYFFNKYPNYKNWSKQNIKNEFKLNGIEFLRDNHAGCFVLKGGGKGINYGVIKTSINEKGEKVLFYWNQKGLLAIGFHNEQFKTEDEKELRELLLFKYKYEGESGLAYLMKGGFVESVLLSDIERVIF